MAHFIGFVSGRAKTRASRLGTKRTGLSAQAQGWNIGGSVYMDHTARNGVDCDSVSFYLNSGSNNGRAMELVARFVLNPDGTVTREV